MTAILWLFGNRMLCKKLGSTSEKISAVGQGTNGAGRRSTAIAELVKRRIDVLKLGIDLGMSFLDTAESYEEGHAEEITGKAIKGMRDKVFIGTKFEPGHKFQGIINAIEGSLRRLGTDYIDLYQVHWPNPAIPISETILAMSKLIEQGKVRYIGMSNFTPNEFEIAQSYFKQGQIVSNQVEYNLYHRSAEADIIPFSERNNFTVIAYSPFNQGNFAMEDSKQRLLNSIAKRYEINAYQVILSWIISRPTVITIPMTMNAQHVRENAAAADIKLLEEDIQTINKTFISECQLIETDRIRVINYDIDETHPIYTTLKEAIENKFNIKPSPVDLAAEINMETILKPVELIETSDKSGQYDYDLVHGRIRFWAWVIAYNGNKRIPAIILDYTGRAD
ncbi:MAG: aldo/keto reductase [Bacteroidia bacterium]|nr:aldo/keto reductase [Bacteroidia bacterium]